MILNTSVYVWFDFFFLCVFAIFFIALDWNAICQLRAPCVYAWFQVRIGSKRNKSKTKTNAQPAAAETSAVAAAARSRSLSDVCCMCRKSNQIAAETAVAATATTATVIFWSAKRVNVHRHRCICASSATLASFILCHESAKSVEHWTRSRMVVCSVNVSGLFFLFSIFGRCLSSISPSPSPSS